MSGEKGWRIDRLSEENDMQDASDIAIGDTIEASAPPKFDFHDLEKRVSAFVTDSTDRIVKAAKDNPTAAKAAVAAGAAVVVGALAAATIPAIRASRKKPVRKAAAKPAAAKPATPRRTAAKKAS